MIFPFYIFANSPSINEINFKTYNNTYRLLSDAKYHEGINEILQKEPFYTNFTFSITYAPQAIVTKMFNDLEYTAENGKRYANSPYLVDKVKDYYKIQVKNYAQGELYLPYINNRINRYVYFIKGTFDAFVTLDGKMIVDIQYQQINRNIHFNIKAFLILTNPIYWKLFKKARQSVEFGEQINKLIDINVRYIIKLGKITVKGIYRDSQNKFKF